MPAANKKPRIRPLALGVFRRADGCFLLNESRDSVKDQTFYRPLGGGIEFGETGADALRREIREEINADILNIRFLRVFESIFIHEGRAGHEIVLLYTADFTDASLYKRDRVAGELHKHEPIDAQWLPLSHFGPGGPPLYPERLLELLQSPATWDGTPAERGR